MKSQPTWNAADYSVSSSAQLVWGQQLLEKLNLVGNEDVLDVGCGDGKVTESIARLVPQGSVTGIDSSEDMIRHACEEHARGAANLSFVRADASALEFREEFDVVFSNAALHWVKDHGPVLRGIQRALRPGGRILLQMGGHGNASGVIATMKSLIESSRWADYFGDFSSPYGFHGPEEYREWLSAAGLHPQRIELLSKDMTHDHGGFESWIRTTWLPYTQRVPEEFRDSFVSEFVTQHLVRFPPDAGGIVHTSMKRLEVEATKSL